MNTSNKQIISKFAKENNLDLKAIYGKPFVTKPFNTGKMSYRQDKYTIRGNDMMIKKALESYTPVTGTFF